MSTAIRRLVDAVNNRRRAVVEGIIEELVASVDDSRPMYFDDAEGQAQFRERVLADYQTYTGAEVAARVGSTAVKPTRLAADWRKSGRVFAVPFRGESLYLAFQFDHTGRPLPTMRAILHELDEWDDW